MSQKKLIIALDFANLDDVKKIIEHIDPNNLWLKLAFNYIYLKEKSFRLFNRERV